MYMHAYAQKNFKKVNQKEMFLPQTWAIMHVRSAYDAMLNGTPSPISAERWYI